jgi:hypothetical protein
MHSSTVTLPCLPMASNFPVLGLPLLTFSSTFYPLSDLWRLFLRRLLMKAKCSDPRLLKQYFSTFYPLWHTEKIFLLSAVTNVRIWNPSRGCRGWGDQIRAPSLHRSRSPCFGVHLQGCCLYPPYSECDPWSSTVSTTWGLVRNAESEARHGHTNCPPTFPVIFL